MTLTLSSIDETYSITDYRHGVEGWTGRLTSPTCWVSMTGRGADSPTHPQQGSHSAQGRTSNHNYRFNDYKMRFGAGIGVRSARAVFKVGMGAAERFG